MASTSGAQATAFGLDIRSKHGLLLLEGSVAQPTGRALELSLHAEQELRSEWPSTGELVCDERRPDGSVLFQIEADPATGYLIVGPTFGTFALSSDGERLRCAPGERPDAAWQRFLIAQLLPFAAVLRGLEVFHASAVVHGRDAVGFVGPSRAGKTSVAFELCRRGAGFLADDVLALERTGELVLGHPGSPVAGVDHAEARRAERSQRRVVVAIDSRERLVRIDGAAEPAPLSALFMLDRRLDGPAAPTFEQADDPRELLAATFNSVLTDGRRLARLLDVCAAAARRKVERVVFGPDVDTASLSSSIEQRLEATN